MQHRRILLAGQALALLCLYPGATPALAHDVRLPDGTYWQHDHAAPYFLAGPIRNVSVTAPQVTSCEKATWPDIPTFCLAPSVEEASVALVQTSATEKGDRVLRTLVASNAMD